MPKVYVRVDGDRIATDVFNWSVTEDLKRPFACELLSVKNRRAVQRVAGKMFEDIFLTMRVILMEELNVMGYDFKDTEFELQTGYVGQFDQNTLPINMEIFANDRPNWYDYGAEHSNKLDLKLKKMRRIAELAVETTRTYLEGVHRVSWRSNCWVHVGAGYYHESPK